MSTLLRDTYEPLRGSYVSRTCFKVTSGYKLLIHKIGIFHVYFITIHMNTNNINYKRTSYTNE